MFIWRWRRLLETIIRSDFAWNALGAVWIALRDSWDSWTGMLSSRLPWPARTSAKPPKTPSTSSPDTPSASASSTASVKSSFWSELSSSPLSALSLATYSSPEPISPPKSTPPCSQPSFSLSFHTLSGRISWVCTVHHLILSFTVIAWTMKCMRTKEDHNTLRNCWESSLEIILNQFHCTKDCWEITNSRMVRKKRFLP